MEDENERHPLAAFWPILGEDFRAALFPEVTGEERRIILDGLSDSQKESDRAKALASEIDATLLRREARREADRIEAEQAGAADSWAPQNIADLFDLEQQEPEIGAFHGEDGTDTGGVFYRGKVNEVHGPSESGKTMFVLAVAAQEIEAERHVVMIDYEDDGRAIVNRLRFVFGMERAQIEKYFHYFRPDAPFGQAGFSHITGIGDVSMCIIDAVTESMAVSGLDGRNESEVATWYNEFPKKLASTGIGVVLIDHTPQGDGTRQIGSQHKKSAVDGVSYTAEPVHPFVKGQLGQLRIRVAKDKIGSIRTAALPGGEGKQFWRGDFKIDGRPTTAGDRVRIIGVTTQPAVSEGRAHDVKTTKPVQPALAPLLVAMAEDGEWFSGRALAKAIDWGDSKDPTSTARTYANRLVQAGLADKDVQGKTTYWRVSADGIHTANAWQNDHRFDVQEALGESVRKGGSEHFANTPSEHSEQKPEHS